MKATLVLYRPRLIVAEALDKPAKPAKPAKSAKPAKPAKPVVLVVTTTELEKLKPKHFPHLSPYQGATNANYTSL